MVVLHTITRIRLIIVKAKLVHSMKVQLPVLRKIKIKSKIKRKRVRSCLSAWVDLANHAKIYVAVAVWVALMKMNKKVDNSNKLLHFHFQSQSINKIGKMISNNSYVLKLIKIMERKKWTSSKTNRIITNKNN